MEKVAGGADGLTINFQILKIAAYHFDPYTVIHAKAYCFGKKCLRSTSSMTFKSTNFGSKMMNSIIQYVKIDSQSIGASSHFP